MTIKRINGFHIDEDEHGRLSIGIESDRIAACVDGAGRRDLAGVFGNTRFGFSQDDTDFLKELTNLEKMWFGDIALRDIEGVYSLEGCSETPRIYTIVLWPQPPVRSRHPGSLTY